MHPPDWVTLSDEQVLERRIRGLKLKIEGSGLEPLIQQLYDELSARGLTFHPPCHVGDEWFVPEGLPVIFVPFYLVHPRLRELERKMILEVEGETPEWFMQLMRHEAAHAYSYAYRLYRKRKWQETFGLASTEQSEFYRPKPYSRSFVVHLDDWYAQSHPDEDFAETFAVWLTPGLDWREEYRDWKALRKLEYVDGLMKSIAGTPPVHLPAYRVADYDCLNVTLRKHYARKRELYEDAYEDFYDKDLRKLFAAPGDAPERMKAAAFLRQNRRNLLESVCRWSNGRKYRVNELLSDLISRCRGLDLYVHPADPKLLLEIAAFITTLVMNHLFTGRFKRTK
ncbi:MAG: hypothetical protein MUE94_11365 [Verrucomicrobia bacterium]|jgi:hypothetical protein|nr:hypothetical protein [Verrucomicrobiota bacterium]